jgi:integrase
MSRAWVFQRPAQVRKFGEDHAPWYAGWYAPDGKRNHQSFGPGVKGKDHAERHRRMIETQLLTGTYESKITKTWEQFRKQYTDTIVAGLAPRSRSEVETSLEHFQRIVKPIRMTTITTEKVDQFVAARRREPGKKKGDPISPATINKDLRHVKAALKKAQKWGYLTRMPDFDFEREPSRLPRFITEEHFAAVYDACDKARLPADLPNITPADWWRGLIVTAYMTGWRISELLALRREDLDLAAGHALTRHEDNKGKRDERVKLHPVVIDHLQALAASFDSHIFPWNYNRTTLDGQFHRLQREAKIHLPCRAQHVHTEACHSYGFHDLRRAFATENAGEMSGDALQKLMRHKSYATTQGYINLGRQLDDAVDGLHVPKVLKKKRRMNKGS